MPVIPTLSEAIKIPKNFTGLVGGLPPEVSALYDALSQAQMGGAGMQPIPFPPGVIPVLPFGIAITIALQKLEGMMFKSYQDISKLTELLRKLYQRELEKAIIQREIAEEKLYNDLIKAQQDFIEQVRELKEQIQENNNQINDLEAEQISEMERYRATIFPISEAAKKAEANGNIDERDRLVEQVSSYDDWLAEIIKITITVIQLKLDTRFLEADLAVKEPYANMTITRDWNVNIELATIFQVAVPYRPDLPPEPNYPTSPPMPKESEFVKAQRRAFNKWVTTPTIMPFGVPIAGILFYIQAISGPLPPQVGAKIESAADAVILSGGGIV